MSCDLSFHWWKEELDSGREVLLGEVKGVIHWETKEGWEKEIKSQLEEGEKYAILVAKEIEVKAPSLLPGLLVKTIDDFEEAGGLLILASLPGQQIALLDMLELKDLIPTAPTVEVAKKLILEELD